jgi:hypothetical protein
VWGVGCGEKQSITWELITLLKTNLPSKSSICRDFLPSMVVILMMR